jgi:CheY-like chemotaxis protein
VAYSTPDPPYALVVDEDPLSREIVGDALYRYGLVPLLAYSSEEALELMAGQSAPVLIVLAFRLANMSTSELLATLRADARWARARVLLTSTLPRAYVPRNMQVDAFLQKPFDTESLVRAIRLVMIAGLARGG